MKVAYFEKREKIKFTNLRTEIVIKVLMHQHDNIELEFRYIES